MIQDLEDSTQDCVIFSDPTDNHDNFSDNESYDDFNNSFDAYHDMYIRHIGFIRRLKQCLQ